MARTGAGMMMTMAMCMCSGMMRMRCCAPVKTLSAPLGHGRRKGMFSRG